MTASTRQPPAGGPNRADDLLHPLREGDRDAFVRYFRLFRASVYHFARRLLRDDAAAADATRDALTAAFRHAILDDEITDLEVLTFRCALDACEARPGPAPAIPEGERPGSPGAPRGIGGPEEDAARQRFETALDALEPRQRAALLLHDLQGMDVARSAAVLRLGTEAAGALLFRAREEFREALHGPPGYGDGRKCRQAEEALAGAVGLGLDDDGLARLQRHAGYCRPCRKVMKTWTAAGVGLAAVLMPPPLPEALAAAPVFGDVDGPVPGTGWGRPGVLLLPLARVGRALKGRAAAWVVAAACLALAGGLVVHGLGLRPVVLMQSVGPAVRLIVAPPADGSEPAAARGAGRETTTTTAPAIGISGDGAAGPTAASSVGPAQPGTPADTAQPGTPADDTAPPGETPPADGSQSGESEAAPEAEKPDQQASSSADRRAGDDDKEAKASRKGDDKEAKASRKDDDKEAKASRKDDDKVGGKKSGGGKKSDGGKKSGGGKKTD